MHYFDAPGSGALAGGLRSRFGGLEVQFLADTESCHFGQMTAIFRNLSSRRTLDLAAVPTDFDGRGLSENFGTSCKRWILSEKNRMPAKVVPSPKAGLREAENPDKSPKMHDYPR